MLFCFLTVKKIAMPLAIDSQRNIQKGLMDCFSFINLSFKGHDRNSIGQQRQEDLMQNVPMQLTLEQQMYLSQHAINVQSILPG